MTDGDKKIIVDEDWKSQVEREKAGTDDSDTDTVPVNIGELPEATFEVLVSTLAAQAMAAMVTPSLRLPSGFSPKRSRMAPLSGQMKPGPEAQTGRGGGTGQPACAAAEAAAR